MNIVLLMSGSSQAFQEAGYQYPKNLVEIAGVPLVQRVIRTLQPLVDEGAQIFCVIKHDENRKHHTGAVIRLLDPKATLIEVTGATAGAACSALLAVEHINNDEPLIIVNGDQIIEEDLVRIVADFKRRELDGGIIVFEDIHPRWSFVKCDPNGRVVETAEKRPISNQATAGFYYFLHGRDFVLAATEAIKKDAQVNGLFFICPAYNELVLRQRNIGVYPIARRAYWTLASPNDVHTYEEHLKSAAPVS